MMAFTSRTRIMSRPLFRLLPSAQSVNVGLWHRCSVATASNHPHHPNPGNFSNRPKQELSEIGHKGGKKGGKATGVGGFHNMDPEKQHAIASKGGHAHADSRAGSRAGGRAGARGKAVGNGETDLEAEQHGLSHEPSVVAPGFEEWKTTA